MPSDDGKVIIKVDSNAKSVAADFYGLSDSIVRTASEARKMDRDWSRVQQNLWKNSNKPTVLENIQKNIKAADFKAASDAVDKFNGSLTQTVVKGNIFNGMVIGISASITNFASRAVAQASRALRDWGNEASKTSISMDSAVNTFNAGAYGMRDGANQLNFAREQAEKYGIALDSTMDSYSKFLTAYVRSGGTFQESKQIFNDLNTAIVSLHLGTEKTKNIYVALEQVANKGTLQMEELKRQLGNNLPGAFELAAKAMGVSTAKLSDMMKKGQVMSADFLPKFARTIKEELGGSADTATNQAWAAFNRYGNDLFDLRDAAGDSINRIKMDFMNSTRGIIQGTTGTIRSLQEMSTTLVPLAQSVTITTASFVAFRLAVGVQLTGAITTASWAIAAMRAPIVTTQLLVSGLTASIVANPLLWGGAAIAVSIGAVTYSLQKNQMELKKSAQALAETSTEAKNNIVEMPKLISEYAKLSQVTNKTGLQHQRFVELQQMITSQYPDLLTGIDKEIQAHGKITGAVAQTISMKIKEIEVNKILASQRAAEDKYLQTVSNKWYWKENSVRAVNNRVKAMEEYTKSLDITTKDLQQIMALRESVTKILANGEDKYSGFTGLDGDIDKTKKRKGITTYIEQLRKDLEVQQDIMQKSAAKNDFGAPFQNAKKRATELTLQIERLGFVTGIYKNTQEGLNADLQHTQDQMLQLLDKQGKVVNFEAFKRLRDEAVGYKVALDNINQNMQIFSNTYEEMSGKAQLAQKNLQIAAADYFKGNLSTEEYRRFLNENATVANELAKVNRLVSTTVGMDWQNVTDRIKTDFASAITTPLKEGESAFERFGNIGLNIVQMIGQRAIELLIEQIFLTQKLNAVKAAGSSSGIFAKAIGAIATVVGGAYGGPAGAAAGGAISNAINNYVGSAKGNIFSNGNVVPFAKGGVVSQPTYFPMSNGTGLMGEAGPESVMPLKRMTNGDLGVQSEGRAPNVVINNYSTAQIEVTKRPNNDVEVRVREFDAYLNSERSNSAVSNANSRLGRRGVTAA